MCGRYTLSISVDEVWDDFDLDGEPPDDERLRPRFNIAPTQEVPVLASRAPRELSLFRWGLVPFWAESPAIGSRMINARVESVAVKPAFRRPFQKGRRCVALADGFFEWRREGSPPKSKHKTPMYIRLVDGEPFGIAALHDGWKSKDAPAEAEPMRSFTLLTCEAKGAIADIHDRVPVILTGDALAEWLDESRDSESLRHHLAALPAERFEHWEVSRLVNKPDNDVPECIAKVDAADRAVREEPVQRSLFGDDER